MGMHKINLRDTFCAEAITKNRIIRTEFVIFSTVGPLLGGEKTKQNKKTPKKQGLSWI